MSEVLETPTEAPATPAAPAAPAVAATPAPAPGAVRGPDGKFSTPAAPAVAATPAAPAVEEKPVAAKWQESWREDMAGKLADTATPDEKADHDKLLKRLQRFNSPADAAKALREQDKLISSGTLKRALPKSATPEQLTEWRKDNGIPEAADKYDLGIPVDKTLTDVDRDMLAMWARQAHGVNATPDVVKAGTAAYLEMRDTMAAAIEQRNEEAKSAAVEELRAEWGPEYKANTEGVNSLLRNSPSTVVQGLLSARGDDGVELRHNPDVIRWLAGHARELGYVGATVVPAGGDLGKGIEDELAELQKQMGSDEWFKNAKGQARFIQLTEAKMRMAGRK